MQQITTAPAMTQRLVKAGMEKPLAQAVAQTIAQAVTQAANDHATSAKQQGGNGAHLDAAEERKTLKTLIRLEEQSNLRYESLKKDVAALQSGNVTLQVAVAALNDRVDKFETKVDKLEAKVDKLQVAVANVEGAVASLQSDVADIKVELAKRGGDTKILIGLMCAIAAGVFVVYIAEKLF